MQLSDKSLPGVFYEALPLRSNIQIKKWIGMAIKLWYLILWIKSNQVPLAFTPSAGIAGVHPTLLSLCAGSRAWGSRNARQTFY